MHRHACARETIPLAHFLGEIIASAVADFRAAKAGSVHPLGESRQKQKS
jgi:hypothetical protein